MLLHNAFLIGHEQFSDIKVMMTLPSDSLAPVAQYIECPLRGTGGHGFDPGLRHTKVVKNGTSCSWLGTQTWGRARTG